MRGAIEIHRMNLYNKESACMAFLRRPDAFATIRAPVSGIFFQQLGEQQ